MSFKREIIPAMLPTGERLTAQLIGIGFRLQGEAIANANIEDSIFAASIEGIAGDYRVLSLLVDWFDIHSERVLADRLYHLALGSSQKRVRVFWAAMAQRKSTDRRFLKFAGLHSGKRIDLLPKGTKFHIARSGEDERFVGTALRVPEGAGLRRRPSDVLSPSRLASVHLPYYYRLLIGPTYRANMWAHLELDTDLSTAELARRCYGSFATAWHVKREWNILKEAA